jgi:hypothetical protein
VHPADVGFGERKAENGAEYHLVLCPD